MKTLDWVKVALILTFLLAIAVVVVWILAFVIGIHAAMLLRVWIGILFPWTFWSYSLIGSVPFFMFGAWICYKIEDYDDENKSEAGR